MRAFWPRLRLIDSSLPVNKTFLPSHRPLRCLVVFDRRGEHERDVFQAVPRSRHGARRAPAVTFSAMTSPMVWIWASSSGVIGEDLASMSAYSRSRILETCRPSSSMPSARRNVLRRDLAPLASIWSMSLLCQRLAHPVEREQVRGGEVVEIDWRHHQFMVHELFEDLGAKPLDLHHLGVVLQARHDQHAQASVWSACRKSPSR